VAHKVQHVFKIDPCRLLEDLGVSVEHQDGQILVPHPFNPDYKMGLDGQSLVSTKPVCRIVACSLFDYIKFRLGDYEAVMEFLVQNYGHAAQLGPGVSLSAIRGEMVHGMTKARSLFDFMLTIRDATRRVECLAAAYLWCRHRSITI
jgi:hypothetical protein